MLDVAYELVCTAGQVCGTIQTVDSDPQELFCTRCFWYTFPREFVREGLSTHWTLSKIGFPQSATALPRCTLRACFVWAALRFFVLCALASIASSARLTRHFIFDPRIIVACLPVAPLSVARVPTWSVRSRRCWNPWSFLTVDPSHSTSYSACCLRGVHVGLCSTAPLNIHACTVDVFEIKG